MKKAKFGDTVGVYMLPKGDATSLKEVQWAVHPQILKIGSGKYIPELELAIIGMGPGEKRPLP